MYECNEQTNPICVAEGRQGLETSAFHSLVKGRWKPEGFRYKNNNVRQDCQTLCFWFRNSPHRKSELQFPNQPKHSNITSFLPLNI